MRKSERQREREKNRERERENYCDKCDTERQTNKSDEICARAKLFMPHSLIKLLQMIIKKNKLLQSSTCRFSLPSN